ncbi:MAG: hypothetical protein QOF72_1122, partial [Blastocatellia bacterium]|nr:hypothetical protein [Blastocatellia bacterium]
MKKILTLLLTATFAVGAVMAQTPPNPQKPREDTTEDIVRITTSLVQTDVVVTDKSDRIVSDLKLEDFKVYENGKRQDVKFLEFVNGDSMPRIEGSININGQPAEPDIARNLSTSDLRRVFAFVVDDLTIPFQD